MTNNPFIEYNETLPDNLVSIPKFPKDKLIHIRISEEAYTQLLLIGSRFSASANATTVISTLLEKIGLFVLNVEHPKEFIDEESGVTTSDCRQSGFEDGLNGNPTYFLQMFQKKLDTRFEQAYMRGYYEGSFIRNKK